MFANLASQHGRFTHQVASMADGKLQLPPRFLRRGFEQSEAVDGSAMNGFEVGVVGLVVGIGRLTKLLGGERMYEPGFEFGLGERVLHRMMVTTGSFDRDEAVAQ